MGGGETIFPKRENCGKENFRGCCEDLTAKVVEKGQGVFVPGKKRQALLFFSHDPDGRHNIYGMHGSCPVRSGEKWIAQQWFRAEPYHLSPHRPEEPWVDWEETV